MVPAVSWQPSRSDSTISRCYLARKALPCATSCSALTSCRKRISLFIRCVSAETAIRQAASGP